MRSECAFCAIVSGANPAARVVYRDEDVVAFFPLEPATVGHTLVVPVRHVEDIWELQESDAHQMASVALKIAHALRAAVGPQGLNMIQSNGHAATQTVGHFHLHLVPRWDDDDMVLRWPQGAAEEGLGLDKTLADVRAALSSGRGSAPPEDRRQHLGFIQSVISRMSQASSSAKTWMLPIVTAAYGYALTKHSLPVTLLGMAAVLVFGVLDANYLKEERAFRRLYDKVSAGAPVPRFAMNPALAAADAHHANYWPDWDVIRSWAVALVYGPILLVGAVIIVWLSLS